MFRSWLPDNDLLGRKHREGKLWFVFLLCIMVLNGQYVLDPVYWDMLVGLFVQSCWLAEHDMNLVELLNQPRYDEGGPNVYGLTASLSSMVYGGLYYLDLPVAAINAVGHIFVWCSGATVLYVFFHLVRPFFNANMTGLACIALLSWPLFQSQTALFSLEAPLTAASLLSFYFCVRRKYLPALLIATVAYHLHPRGAFALGGTGIISFFDLTVGLLSRRGPLSSAAHNRSGKITNAGLSVILHGFSSGVFLLYLTSHKWISGTSGPARFQRLPVFVWCNYWNPLFVIFALLLPVCLLLLILCHYCTDKPRIEETDVSVEPSKLSSNQRALIVRSSLWLATYFVLLFASGIELLPRYLLQAYPILLAAVLGALSGLPVRQKAIKYGLIVCTIWGTLNYCGYFYHPIFMNNGHGLERSMEYQVDLDLNRQLVSYLQSEFDLEETLFITHWPITHMLAIPEAGYVSTDQINVLSHPPLTHASVGTIEEAYERSEEKGELKQKIDKDVLWIHSPNCFASYISMFNESRGDRLVKCLTAGRRKAYVFRRAKTFSTDRFKSHMETSSEYE